MQKFEKREITKKSKNISRWYTDVVLKAELADYGPVRGTMVIRPYGYAIWERVQEIFNKMIKSYGVENAYFPLLIPHSLLEKEKEHVKGFAPELAIVTHGGGKKLKEPLVVRPTSETVMYEMYSKWIHSWRDLPLKINQWNNVVRWELRTYLFLRTAEFLWQEGHTVHKTEKEAIEMAEKALEWYREIYEEYFAIPVVSGIKSETEKFAGAKTTYGVEALMPDGKVLQGATSHNLGQNFSKVFDIKFQDKNGKSKYVWQTSWGISTRSLGGLFLVHGDNNGLILPPKIAPFQIIVIPVYSEKKKNEVVREAKKITKLLKEKYRASLDNREQHSLGYKINDWELKGVPLRIEVGEKELFGKRIRLVKRVGFEPKEINVGMSDLGKKVEQILKEIQRFLYNKAKKFLEENTHEVFEYKDFKEIMKTKKGFIKAFWCGNEDCEMRIKEESKATTRCLALKAKKGKCIYCGRPAIHQWFFAQAY
jgi:prolyl-tRNA synthetase